MFHASTILHTLQSISTEVEARDVIRAAADLVTLIEPSLLRLWKDTGLTLSQRRVLRQLREEPRSAGSVAEAINLSAPALTRHLTKLQEQGLIERHIDPADRRRVLIELTPSGRKVLSSHSVFRGSPIQAAARLLDASERRATVVALTRLVTLALDAERQRAGD